MGQEEVGSCYLALCRLEKYSNYRKLDGGQLISSIKVSGGGGGGGGGGVGMGGGGA